MEDIASKMKQVYESVYKIEVEVLENGKLPTKAHPSDAGIDVYATEDIYIQPGQVMKHPLNIRMKLPTSCYLEITSKSGLGAKGLLVYAGVIDPAYRGIPHVVMCNLNTFDNIPIYIKKGEKLAQMIPYPFSTLYYVEQVDHVSTDTDRAEGGFGSSGAK
jgi:dUTP pyrophosphatase